jgi:hypothetical protein
MRNDVLGVLESVPAMRVDPSPTIALRSSGKFWSPFAPVSESSSSFAVTPAGSRSIPSPPFEWTAFAVIRAPLVPSPATRIPTPTLPATVLPSTGSAPPTAVSDAPGWMMMPVALETSSGSPETVSPIEFARIVLPVPLTEMPMPALPEIVFPRTVLSFELRRMPFAVFARLVEPSAARPMTFPTTSLSTSSPAVALPPTTTPLKLPETTLRCAGPVPPTRLPAPRSTMPMFVLPTAVPFGSRPTQFASATLSPPPRSSPFPKPVTESPRTVTSPVVVARPVIGLRTPLRSSTRGCPTYPGCVVASIVAGPETTGSAESIAIVCGPVPAMANSIVLAPVAAFAALIASRSEQCAALHAPSLASFVELTVNVPPVGGPPAAVTRTQFENSDVFPAGSVAVAVTAVPTERFDSRTMFRPCVPAAGVVTFCVPTCSAPSPFGRAKWHSGLAKYSTRIAVLGVVSRTASIVVFVPFVVALVICGQFCSWFDPLSPSPGSLAVTPCSGIRSIARFPLP